MSQGFNDDIGVRTAAEVKLAAPDLGLGNSSPP